MPLGMTIVRADGHERRIPSSSRLETAIVISANSAAFFSQRAMPRASKRRTRRRRGRFSSRAALRNEETTAIAEIRHNRDGAIRRDMLHHRGPVDVEQVDLLAL